MTLKDALSYEPVELSFGTSGLRGLVADMTDLECYINTRGFLEFLKQRDSLKAGETVYIAGDLRDSTPRIMGAVHAALTDAGLTTVNCGLIPTPALAYYALGKNAPCIMVTGSHIPADRNGIKFYKRAGEVLKPDEAGIQAAVAAVRAELYQADAGPAVFDEHGTLKQAAAVPPAGREAEGLYLKRYTDVFNAQSFAGKQVVVYQHSAVGRDLLVQLFEALGAKVVPVEHLDTFLSIDTENVGAAEKARFEGFARQYPGTFAIVSTDGDSDRPFVIDETGEFYRGDVLGVVVMQYLGARFAAVPVSSNDAVDAVCATGGIALEHTKIGSPYVIAAMQAAPESAEPKVGWEVNGGFLTGSDIKLKDGTLTALPTRDAALPILCALLAAAEQGLKVSEVFAALPRRFTGGALIDDVSPPLIEKFRAVAGDETVMRRLADQVFGGSPAGAVRTLNITDGLRLIFESGDVIHLRPSGNAPQFRVYSNADTQARADELAEAAVAPGGYIEQLLAALGR